MTPTIRRAAALSLLRLAGVMVPALASVALHSCRSRAFNRVTSQDDVPPAAGEAEARGAANTAAFIGALGRQHAEDTETADGGEDFTWDINCAALPKLTFDPPEPGSFDLTPGAPARARSLLATVLLARASFLTYKQNRFLEAEARRWGFQKFSALDDPSTDTQAFVMSTPRAVLVVFRGSSSQQDLFVDLDLVKEREFGWGSTHRGFTNAYTGKKGEEGIRAKLFEALLDHGYDTGLWTNLHARAKAQAGSGSGRDRVLERATKQLWITGHSLGGALAQLLAADLADRETAFRGLRRGGACMPLSGETNFVSGVVTFGAPRLGDPEYARCFDAALRGRNWRFVTRNDIVPQIPWRELGYEHAGRVGYLSNETEILVDPAFGAQAADMAQAVFGRFLKGDVGGVKAGVEDHFHYPQPLQHVIEPKCLPTRGTAPKAP